MKLLQSREHRLIDFFMVAVLIIASVVLNLTGFALFFAGALASLHFVVTLTTDFTGRVSPPIPFRFHGLLEAFVALSLLFLVATNAFGGGEARTFYLVVALAIAVVWFVTDYRLIHTE